MAKKQDLSPEQRAKVFAAETAKELEIIDPAFAEYRSVIIETVERTILKTHTSRTLH